MKKIIVSLLIVACGFVGLANKASATEPTAPTNTCYCTTFCSGGICTTSCYGTTC